jgi:hypothetical protein
MTSSNKSLFAKSDAQMCAKKVWCGDNSLQDTMCQYDRQNGIVCYIVLSSVPYFQRQMGKVSRQWRKSIRRSGLIKQQFLGAEKAQLGIWVFHHFR